MSFRLCFSKLIHCLEKGWDSFVLVASQCRFSIWPFVVSAAESWRRGGNLLEAGSSLVRWMLGESDSRKLVANEYQASPTNQPTNQPSKSNQPTNQGKEWLSATMAASSAEKSQTVEPFCSASSSSLDGVCWQERARQLVAEVPGDDPTFREALKKMFVLGIILKLAGPP